MTAWDLDRWLREDGEPGAAQAWRAWCAELAGPPVLLVAARDAALATRVAARWAGVPIGVGPDPGPGIQERLLGAHAVLWATSAASALGAEELTSLARLESLGAPSKRGIWLADLEWLVQLSDHPDAEAAEVAQRATRLAPWPLVSDVAGWFAAVAPEVRFGELGQMLIADEVRRADAEVVTAEAAMAGIDSAIAEDETQLAAHLAAADRLARHLRGGVRRQLQRVTDDLGSFLIQLEQALPAEMDALPHGEDLARTLPHWLRYVVSTWLAARLDTAARDLHDDLAGIVPADVLAAHQLVAPAIDPRPMSGDSDWTSRVGATLAIGGGAALLLFGLWAPGLVAVAGGVAWSTAGRGPRAVASRARLRETAIEAVRALAHSIPAALDAQIQAADEAQPIPASIVARRSQLAAERLRLEALRNAAASRGARWRERAS